MKNYIFIFYFTLLSLFFFLGSQAQQLKIYTEDAPPLNYIKDGKADGVAVALVQEIQKTSKDHIKGIMVQKRYKHLSPAEVVYGEIPEEATIQIEGLSYAIKFGQSQNFGFFLDMQKGRDFIKENCFEKRILNLFSYTASLSVVALKNGASFVVNFDMSKGANKRALLNHKLNKIDLNKVKIFDHDIFKSYSKIEKNGPYDFIIIDPPSDHGNHFKLDRDYPKLLSRSYSWLKTGGILFTALNSPHHDFNFLKEMMKNLQLEFDYQEEFGLPDSFLETNPQSGLKIIIWRKI